MSTALYYLRKTLLEKIPVSNVTIWRMEKTGSFPKRRQLSPGRVGWLASEVDAWLESRQTVGV